MEEALVGFEEIGEFGTGGGYDWTEMRIYRKGSRVFADTQSGCSCRWYETPSEADLVELPTLAAAERYYEESRDKSCMAQWLDVVEEFRQFGLLSGPGAGNTPAQKQPEAAATAERIRTPTVDTTIVSPNGRATSRQ